MDVVVDVLLPRPVGGYSYTGTVGTCRQAWTVICHLDCHLGWHTLVTESGFEVQ
jgi:hypothetical protein